MRSFLAAGELHPFIPVGRDGRTLSILGRELSLDDSGLPRQIDGFFSGSNTHLREQPRRLLSGPAVFEVEMDAGTQVFRFGEMRFASQTAAACGWQVSGESDDFTLEVDGVLEFDGFVRYRLRLRASASD